jgi:ABC-type nickel/cobalt efflux system permease component RcnA
MKYLVALTVTILIMFATYIIVYFNSSLFNKNDLLSTFYSLVVGVMAVSTILFFFHVLFGKEDNDNKDDV